MQKKNSMVQKYLTPEIYQDLQGIVSVSGVTIDQLIRSGQQHTDSSIGVYAGDAECYSVFSKLLDKIICDYHNVDKLCGHNSNFHYVGKKHSALSSKLIKSTRVRVARNLKGFAFPSVITSDQRLKVEDKIVSVLEKLTGNLKGDYFSLSCMSESGRCQLIAEHLLFKEGDRFLASAGINRDWPAGRGIFIARNRKFIVWVNEEDHLRVISMQAGGELLEVFEVLKEGLNAFAGKLYFAYDQRLGFLNSCPSNIGTGMRASMHLQLKNIIDHNDFSKQCDKLNLSVRGVHGEHSQSEDGIVDISNKFRFAITEAEIIQTLLMGAAELLAWENSTS